MRGEPKQNQVTNFSNLRKWEPTIHDTDWLKNTFSPAASGSEARRTTARGVIQNDDFYRNTASQHCFEWLRHWFNLKRWVALKIVMANITFSLLPSGSL